MGFGGLKLVLGELSICGCYVNCFVIFQLSIKSIIYSFSGNLVLNWGLGIDIWWLLC